MWRLSLAFLPLLLVPTPVDAAPLIAFITTTVVPWFNALPWLGQALIRLGGSLILSLLAQALAPRPNQKRQLNIPNSRPPKRFVYGRFRTYGTPAPWRVRGRILYGCIILNSRPSAGGDIRIWMDKRRCRDSRATGGADFTDAIYDFSGEGAILDDIEDFRSFGTSDLTNPRVWIGRGDQTGPPDLIRIDPFEPQDFFEDTDAWKGLTVMWLRIDFGRSRRAESRWRAAPPDFEVEMDWSEVWDPRDEAQDPDDPDTWTFSNNQALVLLDGLRQNPIRQYPMRQLHMPSFIEAADVADEPVELYHASVAANVWDDPETRLTEPRYRANGLLVWAAGELADQLSPIAQAGAGELVRIGGQVGYASGEYRPPMMTVTDIVESGGIDYQVLKPGRDLPRFVKGVYISPARDWQEAELTPLEVEGATGGVGEDGVLEMTMPFVTSATQGMRVQQIVARQLARQRVLSVTLWPEAAELVAGATIATGLPAPFTRVNGEWTVVAANPGLWAAEVDGQELAVRVPVTLRQNDAGIWVWVPEEDEQEVVNEDFNPAREGLDDPENVTLTTGSGVSFPGQARLRVSFDPVDGADDYEIFLREVDNASTPTTDFQSVTVLTPPVGLGALEAFLQATAFVRYQAGVQARAGVTSGSSISTMTVRRSEIAVSPAEGTVAVPLDYDLGIPLSGSAVGGAGEIVVEFTAPTSLDYLGMELWVSDTNDVGAATLLFSRSGAAGGVETFTHTGLGAAVTKFYFARSIGTFGVRSAFTASVSDTTDP
jgi:hypothetical protein